MTKPVYAFVLVPTEHAKLSASSAHRWMACAGSVALSVGLQNASSIYAAEGTAAHYIAAECQIKSNPARGSKYLGQMALVEGHEIEITEDLLDAVQDFLDYIRQHERKEDVHFVEQSFTTAMAKLHPDFGGSADRVMWRASEKLLRVYDYKHGAGIAVTVEDNKQMKYYALGALLANPQFSARLVEMVIAQPRCEHEDGRIRMARFPAMELVDYAADLVEAARASEAFDAPLVAGKKQCQFCPAAAANKCPELTKFSQALAAADFSPIGLERYSAAQIAEFLAKAPLVEAAISAVREFAYVQACQGVDFPGWKLVDKRATRKWVDEAAFKRRLNMRPEYMTEPKLKSPAQIEKILGKKEFERVTVDLVVKESSGYTLAPSSDPRPPAAVAQLTDFTAVGGTVDAKEQ